MRLELTTAQTAAVMPHLRHGMTLLGKIERAGFDGSVPTASLPALRDAIRSATAPTKKRKAKSK